MYLEAQFTREKKLTYRMPLVQGMLVEPVLDLGQTSNHALQGATYRFVGACMSQVSLVQPVQPTQPQVHEAEIDNLFTPASQEVGP